MSDLIWYNLFEELNTYFQDNNLSDFRGYAHRPQAVDPTVKKYYYFQLQSENSLNIFDIDGTRTGDNEPFLSFDLFIGTKAKSKTDTTRQSANLAMFEAQELIRQELYNYRYSGVGMSNCLYAATIDSITDFTQGEGTKAVDITQMTITIFYNKTGV